MPLPRTLLFTTTAGLLALAVAMGVGRFAFTPLLPLMQEDGLVDISAGGTLASVHFLGYLLGALMAGRLRGPPKRSLCASLVTIAVATLAMGLTDSFAFWLVLRFLCGLCSAFTLVLVSNHIIKRLAASGHAGLQGWVFSGVGAGIAAVGLGTLALMAVGAGSALGWQVTGAVSLIACFGACRLIGREGQDAGSVTPQSAASRTPLAWGPILAYGAAGIGYVIPATYLPVMAREAVQSPLVFGWSWPLFGAAAFLSTLLSARLHQNYSNRRIWAASQGVMAIGLLLPAIYPHIATIAVAALGVGGTFMIITMAGMKEAHRIAPAQDVQRHIVALTAAFATGQIIGPVFAGWAHDATGSFSAPLIITSIALVGTIPVLAWRSKVKELQPL